MIQKIKMLAKKAIEYIQKAFLSAVQWIKSEKPREIAQRAFEFIKKLWNRLQQLIHQQNYPLGKSNKFFMIL